MVMFILAECQTASKAPRGGDAVGSRPCITHLRTYVCPYRVRPEEVEDERYDPVDAILLSSGQRSEIREDTSSTCSYCDDAFVERKKGLEKNY